MSINSKINGTPQLFTCPFRIVFSTLRLKLSIQCERYESVVACRAVSIVLNNYEAVVFLLIIESYCQKIFFSTCYFLQIVRFK